MATYTKETALYDVGAISGDIESASDLASGAQNYAEQLNQATLDMVGGITDVLNGTESTEGALAKLDGVKDSLAEVQQTYGLQWDELNSFIRFKDSAGQPNLVLGNKDSAWSVVISNTRLSFKNGPTEVAYMDSEGLHVNNYISFGNFQFYQRTNGHFTLKFIGGNS